MAAEPATQARGRPAWTVVAERELRDLWVAGRALPLLFAFALLLSVVFYLAATNAAVNFLEQREAVSLTLQVAVAVGGLLVVLAAGDAVSGERERGTLETLLLTPAPRRELIIGKGCAALSLWAAAAVLAAPYLWFLGRGVGVVAVSLASGFVVGSLLAVFLAGYALAISTVTGSNRVSLFLSLFGLLALYAPSQLPGTAQRGLAGELLVRVDPVVAALRYLDAVIVKAHPVWQDAGWLLGPLLAAVLAAAVVLILGDRLSLSSAGAS